MIYFWLDTEHICSSWIHREISVLYSRRFYFYPSLHRYIVLVYEGASAP